MNILDIDQYSPLEIVNFVAKHLLDQGQKSLNGGEACLYRNGNGLSCAIGCMMTDSQAANADDAGDTSWENIHNGYEDVIGNTHKALLVTLQDIHDLSDATDWKDQLNTLKKEVA